MTYPTRTATIDQFEHEFRSIRRWLNQFDSFQSGGSGTGGIWDIWLQRPQANFARPALNIKHVDSPEPEDQGRSMITIMNDWQIEVLVEDDWQARRLASEIRQRLLQTQLIPLYLWSWQPPPIEVAEVVGGGSIGAGTYSVLVTAVNHDDEESLPTDSLEITVGANAAIEVAIVPWPRTATVAKEYRVYAGSAGSETLEATVAVSTGSVNLFHTLTDLPGGGASPPSSSIMFSHFLRVSQVGMSVLEHPSLDGVFNGLVSFRTSNQLARIAKPGETPIPKPLQTVTVSEEVS